MSLQIIILAAGQGKRMYSHTPKVLHSLAGKPMLVRVLETAQTLMPDKIHVVIGHQRDVIQQSLKDYEINWIHQEKQLGTGHAILQTLPHIPTNSDVLILSADVPLITKHTLTALLSAFHSSPQKSALALLLAKLSNPKGLGRIIRDEQQQIHAIVEEKDATTSQREIQEIYTGICCVQAQALRRWLPQLSNNNAQGEYYLTDIIAMAVKEGVGINSIQAAHPWEIQGVNNRLQLHQLERLWQVQLANQLLYQGVSIADANRIDIRGELQCGYDVSIDCNCVFQGSVLVGDNSSIGPNCVLNNVTLGANCFVEANSVLEDCVVGDNCTIGPFARLRPGTQLASHCKIGNFVETKNVTFGEHSKANHLSYLGDALIGNDVNIGAGTITCNYDGAYKHHTVIEDGVFIGSDSQLVAPVTIGKNATIGAGSSIRKDAPPDALTLTAVKQKTIHGWTRPQKKPPQPTEKSGI